MRRPQWTVDNLYQTGKMSKKEYYKLFHPSINEIKKIVRIGLGQEIIGELKKCKTPLLEKVIIMIQKEIKKQEIQKPKKD